LGSCVLHFPTNVFRCPWLTGWPPSSQYWILFSTSVENIPIPIVLRDYRE
jgi:hypothetical protein